MDIVRNCALSLRDARIWRLCAKPLSTAFAMEHVYSMPSKHQMTFAAKRTHLLATSPGNP